MTPKDSATGQAQQETADHVEKGTPHSKEEPRQPAGPTPAYSPEDQWTLNKCRQMLGVLDLQQAEFYRLKQSLRTTEQHLLIQMQRSRQQRQQQRPAWQICGFWRDMKRSRARLARMQRDGNVVRKILVDKFQETLQRKRQGTDVLP